MRFSKKNEFYRCIYHSNVTTCLLGLEFSDKDEQMHVISHELPHPSNVLVTPEAIKEQIRKAVKEKEKEYNQSFYIKSIEYVKYDQITSELAGTIYYDFACMIIDRMMNFPEYEGSGFGKT